MRKRKKIKLESTHAREIHPSEKSTRSLRRFVSRVVDQDLRMTEQLFYRPRSPQRRPLLAFTSPAKHGCPFRRSG